MKGEKYIIYYSYGRRCLIHFEIILKSELKIAAFPVILCLEIKLKLKPNHFYIQLICPVEDMATLEMHKSLIHMVS